MNLDNFIAMDSFIALSLINTKLRNNYSNLEDLCNDLKLDKEQVTKKFENIDYRYDFKTNQFI